MAPRKTDCRESDGFVRTSRLARNHVHRPVGLNQEDGHYFSMDLEEKESRWCSEPEENVVFETGGIVRVLSEQ